MDTELLMNSLNSSFRNNYEFTYKSKCVTVTGRNIRKLEFKDASSLLTFFRTIIPDNITPDFIENIMNINFNEEDSQSSKKCINVESNSISDSTPIGIREIPNYYKGEILGIRAKDVISDFNLSYNVGTAVTYLLRAGNKPDNSYQQDLEKSLHHIVFELERIKNRRNE